MKTVETGKIDLKTVAAEYFANLKSVIPIPMAASIDELTLELLAQANHEKWCASKKEQGYVYGPVTDDKKKTSDRLVSWSELCDEAKNASRENAKETLSLLRKAGYNPVPIDSIANSIAEELHDSWVRTKLEAGYTYGPVRNDDESKGPKTHRDMLPFATLLDLYPEDAAYDQETARGVVDQMMSLGYAFAQAV